MEIRPIQPGEQAAAVALWRRCDLAHDDGEALADIRRCEAAESSTLLVGVTDGAVVATALVGFDGHRAWAYYVAVDPDHRRTGLGRAMMDAACAWARERGAPKLMLMVAEDNARVLGFYETLGFERAAMTVMRTPLG